VVMRRTLILLRSQLSSERAAAAVLGTCRAVGGAPARKTFAPRLRSPRNGSSLVFTTGDGRSVSPDLVGVSVFSLTVVGFAAERELVSCRTSPPVESGAAAFGGETGVPDSELETLASATTVDIEALKFRRWVLAALLLLLLLLLFSPCCELACKKC